MPVADVLRNNVLFPLNVGSIEFDRTKRYCPHGQGTPLVDKHVEGASDASFKNI